MCLIKKIKQFFMQRKINKLIKKFQKEIAKRN